VVAASSRQMPTHAERRWRIGAVADSADISLLKFLPSPCAAQTLHADGICFPPKLGRTSGEGVEFLRVRDGSCKPHVVFYGARRSGAPALAAAGVFCLGMGSCFPSVGLFDACFEPMPFVNALP
jgi:hypothetical protein